MRIDSRYRQNIYDEVATMLINAREKRKDWLHSTRLACCGRTITDHIRESWDIENLAALEQDPEHPIDNVAEHLVIFDVCEVVLNISPALGIAVMSWIGSDQNPPHPFDIIIEEEQIEHGYSDQVLFYFAKAIADALVAFRAA